jgi:lysozyme
VRRVHWLLIALGGAVGLYAFSRTQRGSEIIARLVGDSVDKLKEFLRHEEGYSLKVYLDNATPPKWTVGVGHLVLYTDTVLRNGQRVKLHPFGPVTEITDKEASEFLKRDTAEALQAVDNSVTRLATTNQRNAMISLAFNVGGREFRESTLVKLFNAGDIIGAADQFGRWIYSGDKTKPNPGLVSRRERERKLFLTAV